MIKLLIISLILFLTVSVFGQGKPMMGTPIDISHPLSDFVAFWPMWEGSGNKVYDLSGNGNTGIFDATNPPTWVPGKFGSALDINNSAIRPISLTSSITLTTGTIAGWIYWSGNDKMWIGSDGTTNYFFCEGSVWKIRGSSAVITFSDAMPTADWYFIVLTLDGVYWRLYVNGVPDSGNPKANTETFTVNTIGNSYVDTTFCWDGDISHVIIYKRALSQGEIALLYRESFCTFESENVALIAPGAAPAPGGGQVITIQMTAYTLILFLCIYMRQKYREAA